MTSLRIGCGYDVHAFAPGRPLMLGGIAIEHDSGLAGHSDGDVLTHAVIDALLGAAGLGDIGDWFPPGDSRYLDAQSLTLLERVADALHQAGWQVVNIDATVVAQAPRLGDQRGRIRDSLANRLELPTARVSVKATTSDHLGAIGRMEGIAAQAVVLLSAPDQGEGAPNS